MTRLGHVLADDGGWDADVGLAPLLSRIAPARFAQAAFSIGNANRNSLFPESVADGLASQSGGTFMPAVAARLNRWLVRNPPSILHAWTPRAIRLAGAVRPDGLPLVCWVTDPALDGRTVKALRIFAERGPMAVVCAAQRVRRRLVEQGVAPACCVVIRPAVDFARINRLRETSTLRARTGASADDCVVLVPVMRDSAAALDGLWALMVQGLIDRGLKAVVVSCGGDDRRLRRLAAASYWPDSVFILDPATPMDAALVASDVLLLSDDGDIPMTVTAWAMAAGVLVLAAAGYAVTELISHKVNGLLYKRRAETGVVIAIAQCLAATGEAAKWKEAARGQAFETFGLRRYVDQQLRVYDNLMSGRPVEDGVVDSALVA